MELNFINIITFINVYASVMLTLFFGLTKHGDRQTNKIISVLLFIFTAQIFYTFTLSKFASQVFIPYHKILFLVYQLSFLVGPLIFLYARTLTNKKSLSITDLLHVIPLFAFIIYIIYYYSKVDSFIMWEHLPFIVATICITIQLITYLLLSVNHKYRSNKNSAFEEESSKVESRFDICKNIFLGYILLWILCLHVLSIYMLFINPQFCSYTASIWGLSSFTVLNGSLIIVIYKPNILFKKEKYQYSLLSTYDKNNIIKKIENYLHKSKAYLDSEISLKMVSNELSISDRFLSQAINETYSVNFRNYINRLRIEYSIELLSNESNNSSTVSEIMYDSGFSSKSVFHTLFKEKTSMTPKDFRESKKKVRKPVYEP